MIAERQCSRPVTVEPAINEKAASSTETLDDVLGEDALGDEARLGWRATRTRNAILEASRKLFLERGYAGTRITNISDACGISRAGFYTYFQDKREIFNILGETTYREILDLIALWDDIPLECTHSDVVGWINAYWEFLNAHGAFILSSQSAPIDAETRSEANRMEVRVAWLLGVAIRTRQKHPTETPEALGLIVQSMLDRSWYQCSVTQLSVGADDVVNSLASVIMATFTS